MIPHNETPCTFPLVGYHKKGYPKQEPKILLKPYKNQSQRRTTRSRQILRFARGLRRGLRRKAKTLRPAEALSPRPRPARPRTGYQFSDSPEAGLGNNLVTSIPTDSSDKMSRPVNVPNYSRNISLTLAQYRQSDRRDRGPGTAGDTCRCAHHCAPC